MKKNIILIPALVLSAGIVSCKQDLSPASPLGNTIELEISATLPEFEGSKVTFDESKRLKWEGNEKIAIVFGDNTATISSPNSIDNIKTASATTTCALSATETPGVFAGTVKLGNYKKEDIIGAVYPANTKCAFRYNGGARIAMLIGRDTQVQKQNNVLNGEYAPLYALFDYNAITGNEFGKHTLENIEFKWGCSLLKMNIYGRHAEMDADEILQSVSVKGGSVAAISGTAEVKSDGSLAFNGSNNSTVKVTLEEECTIADKSSTNPVGVFVSLLPRNNSKLTLTDLTIETDKAIYTKTLPAGTTCALSAGTVYPILTDISTYTRNAK